MARIETHSRNPAAGACARFLDTSARALAAACCAVVFGVAGAAAPAAVTPPGAPPPDVEAEIAALQGAWHPSATARASVGWRDNVLLSPFAPIARAFGRAEIDAMLLRPMRNRWEFVSFLNADVLRYVSPPPETGGEQQWSAHAEGRWQPVAPLRVALKATGYLQDMVIDLSETEAQRVVAPTRVRGGYAGLAPRLSLPAGLVLEPLVQVKRTDYREYPGDYDEARGGGRREWRPRGPLMLAVAWFEQRRRYHERAQFTAGGRPLPDTRLRFRQRDGEAKVRAAWQAGGDWVVGLAAGSFENRDEASGYFDYDQRRVRLEIEWRRGRWLALLEGAAKRMEFRVQTVGTGIAPPPRLAEDYEAALRIEREVSAAWGAFAEHRWERSRANEPGFSYRANTVLAGVQRSF